MNKIIKKLEEIQKQRESLLDDLRKAFEDAVKQLFRENEKLHSVSMYLNNHEFNDGDATYFSLGFENLELWDADDEEYENEELQQKFVDLFAATQDVHEVLYSEHFGELRLTRDEVLED
jgi:hypothetical protein